MEESASHLLYPLRIAAAKQVVGLIHSWEIPPVADQLLSEGVYSDSLARLAEQTQPIMSEVGPLLATALRELQLPCPSETEAVWFLAGHCMRRIVSNPESILESLDLIERLVHSARHMAPDKEYWGDGLGVESLYAIYLSYFEPNENYYPPENRYFTCESERLAFLDKFARDEATRWLERHQSGE